MTPRSRGTVLQAAFPTSKADPLGKMPLTKFVAANRFLEPAALKKAKRINYSSALRLLRLVSARLSLHSFRRGAVSYLSRHFSLDKVARLTGHLTTEARDSRGIRVYAPPSPRSRAARGQMRMAALLWNETVRKGRLKK